MAKVSYSYFGKLSDEYFSFADVDNSGDLSAEDALLILKYVAGMIETL